MQEVYNNSKVDYINLINDHFPDSNPNLDINEIKINDREILNKYFDENEKTIYVKKINDVYDENEMDIRTNQAYFDYGEKLKSIIDTQEPEDISMEYKLKLKFTCGEKCYCDDSGDNLMNQIDDQYIGSNVLDIKMISDIYDKIISTQSYLKKRYQLNNDQLLELMFVRAKENKLYTIPSIYSKELNQQYIKPQWFSMAINGFIFIRQSHAWDQIYVSAPDIYVKILLQMDQDKCSFMTLYHLEYYLKRHLQKVLTDFTLNYKVLYDKMNNHFIVVQGNEKYAEFILQNVKQIDNYVNQHINNPEIIQNLPLHDQIKKILKQNQLHVNFIAKGGNLINMLLDSCNKSNNAYSLNDYTNYFKNLSDWDFDIKINIHNPLDKVDIIDVNNMCSPEYNNIHQQIKKVIIGLIIQYFTNIESHNSTESITNAQNMIQCQIKYVNHLVQRYRGDQNIQFDIIKKHIAIKFHEPNNIDLMLCNLDDKDTQDAIANSKSVIEESKTIFSYISQQFIGEKKEYFDLTRLSIRIETSGSQKLNVLILELMYLIL